MSNAVLNLKALTGGTARLMLGSVAFLRSGQTPQYAYRSLVSLFCLTAGRSNDWLAKIVGLFNRPYALDATSGVLGDFQKSDVKSIADELRLNGFHVFKKTLPKDLVERLVQLALSTPCRARAPENAKTEPKIVVFDRSAPQGVVCDFEEKYLISSPEIQELLGDPSFLAVAQEYLGSRPTFSELSMWWTSSITGQPDPNAAQHYHFDMDHIRWLKFFIYLTDVGTDNGPHCFVSGTHRTGGITPSLLSRGYSRLPDEDVKKEYDKERFIEFTGPAGTVLAEDTRGLHKGKAATQGDRLMLQLEFSVSAFGGVPSAPAKLTTFHQQRFKDWVMSHPRLFRRWLS
jgi:hypothetical protein